MLMYTHKQIVTMHEEKSKENRYEQGNQQERQQMSKRIKSVFTMPIFTKTFFLVILLQLCSGRSTVNPRVFKHQRWLNLRMTYEHELYKNSFL